MEQDHAKKLLQPSCLKVVRLSIYLLDIAAVVLRSSWPGTGGLLKISEAWFSRAVRLSGETCFPGRSDMETFLAGPVWSLRPDHGRKVWADDGSGLLQRWRTVSFNTAVLR